MRYDIAAFDFVCSASYIIPQRHADPEHTLHEDLMGLQCEGCWKYKRWKDERIF